MITKAEIEVTPSIDDLIQELEKVGAVSDNQLKRVAEVINKGVEDNISRGLEYSGSPVSPLRLSTIKAKGNARPLYRTGELFRSIVNRKAGKDVYEIFVSSNRSQIVYWLQTGTRRMVARPFFGITKEADNEIDKILAEEAKEK